VAEEELGRVRRGRDTQEGLLPEAVLQFIWRDALTVLLMAGFDDQVDTVSCGGGKPNCGSWEENSLQSCNY
jgi:hypothetical protein